MCHIPLSFETRQKVFFLFIYLYKYRIAVNSRRWRFSSFQVDLRRGRDSGRIYLNQAEISGKESAC